MEFPKESLNPKSIKELASDYSVSIYIMRNWINLIADELGKINGLLSPRQLKIIYENYDLPAKYEEKK